MKPQYPKCHLAKCLRAIIVNFLHTSRDRKAADTREFRSLTVAAGSCKRRLFPIIALAQHGFELCSNAILIDSIAKAFSAAFCYDVLAMDKPRCLIVRTAGTNCDMELAHAFELAGAVTQKLHINELIADPSVIDRFALIGFPGGFSYGDDIAAGRIFANQLRHKLMDHLLGAADRGVPMIGICNGFQVMVKLGLLPDPRASQQTATLADNHTGRFIARWGRMSVPQNTVCVWTQGLSEMELPIAHAQGRFVPESNQALARWHEKGQIALKYAADDNPNGSTADIAGICDPSGLILGLMPHPERWIHLTNHPRWQRQSTDWQAQTPAGLKMFQNAVNHVLASTPASV